MAKNFTIVVALGAIASAIALGKGLYGAGRYAARQCVSRGWMSCAQYKRNGGYYWAIVFWVYCR